MLRSAATSSKKPKIGDGSVGTCARSPLAQGATGLAINTHCPGYPLYLSQHVMEQLTVRG
jgi:hypothetical protein